MRDDRVNFKHIDKVSLFFDDTKVKKRSIKFKDISVCNWAIGAKSFWYFT